MKRSFRPSKSSSPRSSSRPAGISRPHTSGVKVVGSRPKVSSGHVGQADINSGNQSFMPRQSGWRRRRTPLIVTLLVIVICCLVVLCIAGVVYLVSQGIITIPTIS